MPRCPTRAPARRAPRDESYLAAAHLRAKAGNWLLEVDALAEKLVQMDAAERRLRRVLRRTGVTDERSARARVRH
jgi:hypothetical protein